MAKKATNFGHIHALILGRLYTRPEDGPTWPLGLDALRGLEGAGLARIDYLSEAYQDPKAGPDEGDVPIYDVRAHITDKGRRFYEEGGLEVRERQTASRVEKAVRTGRAPSRKKNPRKRQRKKAAKYQAFLFYAEENETAPIGTFSTLPRARAAVDKWVSQSSGWTPWGGVYKGDELVYEKKWAKGNPKWTMTPTPWPKPKPRPKSKPPEPKPRSRAKQKIEYPRLPVEVTQTPRGPYGIWVTESGAPYHWLTVDVTEGEHVAGMGHAATYQKAWAAALAAAPTAKGNPIDWDVPVELAARAGSAVKRAGRRIKRKVRPPKGPPSAEELLFRAEDWKNKASWHPRREWGVYLRAALEDAQRAHQQASKEGDRDMEWAAGRLASALRRELRTLEKKKNPGRTPPSSADNQRRMADARKMLDAARAVYRREPDMAIDMATTAIRMVYSGGPYDAHYGRLGAQIDYDAEKFVREIYKECLSKVKANPTLSRAEMSEFWSRAADERLAEAMGFADVYEWQEWKGKDKDKGDDSALSVVQRVMARKKKAKAARKKNPRGTTTTARARAILSRAMRGT